MVCLLLLPVASGCQHMAPPSNSIDGEVFVVGDSEGSAELRFKMGKEEEVLTYVCASSDGEGGIEQLGTYRAISYLPPESYKVFQEKYGGDQSACPAGFLNSKTKSARLTAADEALVKRLKSLHFEGKKYGVKLRFKGRRLNFEKGVARDGSPLVPNFGGTLYYLVTEIVETDA